MWARVVSPNIASSAGATGDYYSNGGYHSQYWNNLQIGGSDVERMCSNFVLDSGGGSTVVTGLGFSPDLIFFATSWQYTANGFPNFADYVGDPKVSWGVSHKDGSQWGWALNGTWYLGVTGTWWFEDGILGGSYMQGNWGNGDAFMGFGTPGSYPSDTNVISVASHDADGFTIAALGASRHYGVVVGYLALQFGTIECEVGVLEQPAATGLQTVTTGFDAKALFLTTAGRDHYTSSHSVLMSNLELCVGAAAQTDISTTTEGSSSYARLPGDFDRFGPSMGHESYADLTSVVISHMLYDGTLAAEANADLGITNGFGLNWSTTDGEPRRFGYVAFGADEDWDATPPLANVSFRASNTQFTDSPAYVADEDGNIQIGFAHGINSGEMYATGCMTAVVQTSGYVATSTSYAGQHLGGGIYLLTYRLLATGIPSISGNYWLPILHVGT